jgi:hypothetical protein
MRNFFDSIWFIRICWLVDIKHQQMGCRWMHLKILDSMLWRPMFFWILPGSTTSLSSLECKLCYALHVHMNFNPCIYYCLLCSYTVLAAAKFAIDASDIFFSSFLFSSHSTESSDVYCPWKRHFLIWFLEWPSLQLLVFESQIWQSLELMQTLKNKKRTSDICS